jgi:hypothetical protein
MDVMSVSLQAPRAQTRMIVGSASQLPPKFALWFLNCHVINAGVARFHQSKLVTARAFESPHFLD